MKTIFPKQILPILTLLAVAIFSQLATATEDGRPNIVVIMVDDLGYSDIGCYGGEIETPCLDRLAAGGLRFSQFYNTAKCHSSRVSLLSGQYCIAAGDKSLKHAVTSAEVLKAGGYFTAMVGKWHLQGQPTDFGFDRYFGHLSGACNYFKGDGTFRLNGEPWKVPEKDFYTTVANVDYALRFLREARETKKPWYLYVAFNAPHAPLQALPQDYAKYKGKYDRGWDAIRDARIAKQKQTGLLPKSLKPSPRPEHIPAWQSLSEARRTWEAKRMTTLAAMIDRVDQEIGRLVDDLRKNDELDNTLILFVSDNGACPYDRRSIQLDAEPTNGSIMWSDSTGWAWARNCPFRYYKQNQFEGGISTPAIIHWPDGLKRAGGTVCRTPAHLIDVLPTLAELGQSPLPQEWPGRELRPVSGQSLVPILQGKTITRHHPIHLLFSSDRGLRDGDWKAVSFRGQAWELYNVAKDRTELNDLATSQPKRLKSMTDRWTAMTRDVLHAPSNSYSPTKPAELPHRHREWTNFEVEPKGSEQKKPKKPRSIRARKDTKPQTKKGAVNSQASKETKPQRPNIVLIFTDDQRYDAVGYAGNSAVHTPNLDRLARAGLVFQNCFVNTSICSISRANLMSGQYPSVHGIDDFHKTFSREQLRQTVPARLQRAGYQTALIGKWGIGDSPAKTQQGADVFDYWAGQPMQTCFFHQTNCRYVKANGFDRPLDDLCDCPADSRGKSGYRNRIGKANLREPLHVDSQVTPIHVERFLDGRDTNKPFCLMLFFKSPHGPFFDWDPAVANVTDNRVMPVPPDATLANAEREPIIIQKSLGRPAGMNYIKQPKVLDRHLRDYYRLIASMDLGVGRVTELLEQYGLADNTVILFTSDNGHFKGEHGLAGKWLMYEPSLRVPGFIYDPRKQGGKTCQQMIITTDFSVTMLSLAGIPIPKNMTGRDLTTLFADPNAKWREDFYYDHPYGHHGKIPRTVGVRGERYVYTRYIDTTPPFEQLFDLHVDPNQLHNLADTPKQAALLKSMRRRCKELAHLVNN